MSFTLRIQPEAEADMAAAKKWYDDQRDGLGVEFIVCVEETLASITQMPAMHGIVHKDVRRAVVRRFPYVVYYRIVGTEVVVFAIVHGRRDARHWQSRV